MFDAECDTSKLVVHIDAVGTYTYVYMYIYIYI